MTAPENHFWSDPSALSWPGMSVRLVLRDRRVLFATVLARAIERPSIVRLRAWGIGVVEIHADEILASTVTSAGRRWDDVERISRAQRDEWGARA